MEQNYIYEQSLYGGLSLPTHMVSCQAKSEYILNIDQHDGIILKIKWDVNFLVHIRPKVFVNDDGCHVRIKLGCFQYQDQPPQANQTTLSAIYRSRNKMSLKDKSTFYDSLLAEKVTDSETKRLIFEQVDREDIESLPWKCWMVFLIHVDLFGQSFRPLQWGIQHTFTNSNSVVQFTEIVRPCIPEIENYPYYMNFKFSFCVAHMTERSLREIAMENVVKLIQERPYLDLEIPITLKYQLKSKYESCRELAKGYAGTNKSFYKEIFECAIKIL